MKNGNVGQKSKFSSRIEILVKLQCLARTRYARTGYDSPLRYDFLRDFMVPY